jgi:hypothetical protein
LQGSGLMAPGTDHGAYVFVSVERSEGTQLFTMDQKPVIRKRCSQLNPPTMK